MSDLEKNDVPFTPIIYTPESKMSSPLLMAREMLKDLVRSKELAWRLMVRDISARYRQSFLGFFWAFLPPLATALIFIILNNRKIIDIETTSIPYPAFAILGTVLWQTFVDSLNAPLRVVTAAKQMLAKVNFPKEALVLSAFGQVIFDFAIKFTILIGVFIWYQIPINAATPFALLAILVLILLGMTIGLFLTPVGVLYTDVSSSIAIVVNLWFFVTPVIYPPPQTFPFSLLNFLNPVSPLLTGARDLAVKGSMDNPLAFFIVAGITVLVLLCTWVAYRLVFPILAEKMSAS